jgi:hypothetical protein
MDDTTVIDVFGGPIILLSADFGESYRSRRNTGHGVQLSDLLLELKHPALQVG